MEHLSRCIKSSNDFDKRQIAGILRVLLLDTVPLYQQINREFAIKIRFWVGNHFGIKTDLETLMAAGAPTRFPIPAEAIIGDAFKAGAAGPPARPGPVRDEVDHKRLLSLVVAFSNKKPASVLDVIKNLAYVDGVVHAGSPSTSLR